MFGGGPENIHYSTLDQITRDNVHQLEVAWRFDSGDEFPGSEMQCNPIIVDGVMYATTPKLRVVALDAGNGKLIWSFDPNEGRKPMGKMRNRGVMYWEDGAEKRIFSGSGTGSLRSTRRRGNRRRASARTGGLICAKVWGAIRKVS